jgi:hypothetical protein
MCLGGGVCVCDVCVCDACGVMFVVWCDVAWCGCLVRRGVFFRFT